MRNNRTTPFVLIPLTQGKFAAIDSADAQIVCQYKWTAMKSSDSLWYAYRKEGNRSILLHRFLMNEPDGMVDHRDGDGLNCRRKNLRECNDSQNAANRGLQKNNTCGYKGVFWHARAQLWQARTKVNGRNVSLGYYKTAIEAARAYNERIPEFFGEFAKLNEIP